MTGGPSLMTVVEREPKKAADMLHSLAPEVTRAPIAHWRHPEAALLKTSNKT